MGWAKGIHQAIHVFNEMTGTWPNILLANEYTFARIDLLAGLDEGNIVAEPVHKDQDEDLPLDEWKSLSGFRTGDCKVTFCLAANLADGEFELIHDPDPDGESEDEEEVEEENISKERAG